MQKALCFKQDHALKFISMLHLSCSYWRAGMTSHAKDGAFLQVTTPGNLILLAGNLLTTTACIIQPAGD